MAIISWGLIPTIVLMIGGREWEYPLRGDTWKILEIWKFWRELFFKKI
mgnify:CR=1 FL=1